MLKMFSMASLTIVQSLRAVFSIIILSILGISVYLFISISNVRDNFNSVVDNNVNLLSTISDLRYYTVTYRRFALDYGLTDNKNEHRAILAKINDNQRLVDTTLTQMQAIVNSQRIQNFVNDYSSSIAKYRTMQEKYVRQIDNGQLIEARANMLGPMLAPFDHTVGLLSQLQGNLVSESLHIKELESNKITYLITVSSVLISILILALFILSYVLRQKIQRPMLVLLTQMKNVEQGDLGTRLDFNVFGRDEIGDAAQSFDKMQLSLITLVSDITHSAGVVRRISRELHDQVEITTVNSDRQKVEMTQAVDAMSQMQVALNEVADKTNDTAEQACLSTKESSDSRYIVSSSIEESEALSQIITQASTVINELHADSENIGNVSEVISSIADQTNLLALNAAIEAARAGQAGRGFAVVADEVRNLAQKTQTSISEINMTISALQAKASQASDVMNESRLKMQSGLEQTQKAGDSIEAIYHASENISSMMTMVAAATEEQTAMINDLHTSVGSIEQTSETLMESAHHTQTASETLITESERLASLTSKFKL
ncbi:methyl-accepting chemotaxis protein [Photobacterium nomapromontoriensis]|uniref:methyl-accepting chemotaxis protein n=1 Tax=Photobacterium nomapromontoriensis TaxID=2910237 RepID=UPI003D0C3FA3